MPSLRSTVLLVKRVRWTDERLDDSFGRVERELELLREEMREGFRETRGDILALHRQMAQIGWALAGTLAAALAALIVALM
jgi:hypothetical protein